MDESNNSMEVVGGAANELAVWAKESEESYEVTLERRATALELAVRCVNNGSLDSLDGVDSPLSRKIKKHHGADFFEMNSGWVETSQFWRCPCCSRDKLEISRIGAKGQILAKLVIHHDHMEDALKAAFNKAFVEFEVEEATRTGLALVQRMAPAFSAYAPVLICEDCNNADTAAKKILTERGARLEYQSFSIGQIYTFISVVSHTSHKIDELKVMELWRLVRGAYIARMKLVYEVAKAAVTQDYWYERYSYEFNPIPTLSNSYRLYGGLELVSPSAFCREMTKDNFVHGSNWSRWRTENKKLGKVPPNNYSAMLLSLPGCEKMWTELDESWLCPICERTKYEIVTFEKGKVVFQTHSPTRLSRSWRDIRIICIGCSSVVQGMKRELENGHGLSIGASFNCISPDELRSIIVARPHSSPLINKAKAGLLVDKWLVQSVGVEPATQ